MLVYQQYRIGKRHPYEIGGEVFRVMNCYTAESE